MLIIGAPVYKREWILPDWFAHIEKQDYGLDRIGFIFEAAPDDKETQDCLKEWQTRHPEVTVFEIFDQNNQKHMVHRNLITEDGEIHHSGMREWVPSRYDIMVNLRNNLLSEVRVRKPEYYFSLDTDMLLEDPQTITKLIEATSEYDAVAPLAYMTPDSMLYPNYMSWYRSTGLGKRGIYPLGTTFKVDAIMGVKLMTPTVYRTINYVRHKQGEDIGWSLRCGKGGFNLGAVSGVYCPHIMYEEMLESYKSNGDTRGKINLSL